MAERICSNSLVTRNRKLIKKSKIKNGPFWDYRYRRRACDVATSSLSHDVAFHHVEIWMGGRCGLEVSKW